MMHKLFVTLAVCVVLASCSSPNAPQPESVSAASAASAANAPANAKPAVRDVVEQFGQRMQRISTLAPPGAVRDELHAAYGGLLAPSLLATWRAHPDQVVGREGSSPWPQKIEIDHIDCTRGNACMVSGRVDYMTSNEVEHGGVFMRRAITLDVARTDDGWRIAAVQLAPLRQ